MCFERIDTFIHLFVIIIAIKFLVFTLKKKSLLWRLTSSALKMSIYKTQYS